ncbi:hypothetical protein MNEG_5275 [Monoraphidium neglectum]|uniref:Uncharacterized protein n=1 Tax=Monoraphidium neglectum TaxID=145388 RepID=A0A0D2JV66_9CHLO|nr:hypothetical protein MNEG_5275 [Monoraphidium neglectum]KIZ02688.1 hypothetical protein MNEG_5275 [Monoraphidium neglectum]|eukprot:XP_013901707.1 hypothetical protein MNEG_5275 [Monoraphidium neglectum]
MPPRREFFGIHVETIEPQRWFMPRFSITVPLSVWMPGNYWLQATVVGPLNKGQHFSVTRKELDSFTLEYARPMTPAPGRRAYEPPCRLEIHWAARPDHGMLTGDVEEADVASP